MRGIVLQSTNNESPDFMYIQTEETTIKKQQIEELLRKMNQKPIESKYKVYIIEAFDKLTVQGENSILIFRGTTSKYNPVINNKERSGIYQR